MWVWEVDDEVEPMILETPREYTLCSYCLAMLVDGIGM